MHRKWMKAIAILAVLLISMVSLSMAACPRAYPDLYQAKCGAVFEVPAPGILNNDVKDAGKTLSVADPGLRILPQGTIDVRADGSFTYTAAPNIPTGTYVVFYYKVTDGSCISGQTYVKIQIDCKCTAKAPRIEICEPTLITVDWLYSKGAGCFGCSGVTTSGIDISKIPLPEDQVPGVCYEYKVTCPGCQVLTGYVCLLDACDINCVPFPVCEGHVPDAAEILDKGQVTCSCDPTPTISDIVLVDDHWEYKITCESACGPVTQDGCPISIQELCEVVADDIIVCPGTTLAQVQAWAQENSTCGDNCVDTTPVIDVSTVEVVDGFVTGGYYTACCTVGPDCESCDRGEVIVETCEIDLLAFCLPPDHQYCVDGTLPTDEEILSMGLVSCTCGDPEVTDVSYNYTDETGVAHWDYEVTCVSENGCISKAKSEFTDCACGTCFCNPDAPPICTCVGHPLTDADFLANGAACLFCDYTPSIDDSQVNYNVAGEYKYTVTCSYPAFCFRPPSTIEGIVTVTDVPGECGCPIEECCTPVAPYICWCLDQPIEYDDFIDAGVRCEGSNCGAPIIDFHEVDVTELGLYNYYVTCGDDEECEEVEGHVCVDVVCGPAAGVYSTTNLLAGQNYDAGDVTVSLNNQGYLVVELEAAQGTDDCGDWTFEDCSNVYIGLTPTDTCAPGQLSDLTPEVCTETYIRYKVLLSKIAPTYCSDDSPTIYMDVHATMNSDCGGQTAWAVGTCAGGCAWDDDTSEICFEIPCNCVCPTVCHC
jgi:3D (Asp-Asp-Asp) domain-containing protein